MKKLNLIIILFALMSTTNAQTWFDIGLKGGIGTSFWYNKQIFDNQKILHKWQPGYTIGGKIGFNFIQEHQITFDVLMSSISQDFTYKPEGWTNTTDALREFTIGGLDMLLMYRANRNGTYFEVGPQWSKYSTIKYADSGGDFISPLKSSELISKSNFGVAMGFGGYIFGTDNFGVSTGVRFNYMFNDLASTEGRDANFPIFIPNDKTNPTNNIGVIFMIEINYDFGYLVSPTCGTRGKLFVL